MLAQSTFFKILKITKSSRTVWFSVVLITGVASIVAHHPGEEFSRARTTQRNQGLAPRRTPSWEQPKSNRLMSALQHLKHSSAQAKLTAC